MPAASLPILLIIITAETQKEMMEVASKTNNFIKTLSTLALFSAITAHIRTHFHKKMGGMPIKTFHLRANVKLV